MTRLLLLRHAESEWNAAGRWQGLANPPLSARGEEQASRAGLLLAPFGFSWLASSDLQRARGTAERIAPALDLAGPLLVQRDLREYDVGAWSGLTRAEIEAGWPGAIEDWRQGRLAATPDGERNDAFVARISAAVARVATDQPGATVLVITHGGVIGALSRSLGGSARRYAHLAGIWVESDGHGLGLGSDVALLGLEEHDAEVAAGVLDPRGR